MPTLAVGMWRFSSEFDMPTASVGMAPDLPQQELMRLPFGLDAVGQLEDQSLAHGLVDYRPQGLLTRPATPWQDRGA